jgi:hypothetical protein
MPTLERSKFQEPFKAMGKIFVKLNITPVYFAITKDEFTRTIEHKKLDVIRVVENYPFEVIEQTADPFLKRHFIENVKKETFNTFYSTIEPLNIQPDQFDSVVNHVKDVLYNTFVKQIPNAKMDSSSSGSDVNGLSFDKFVVVIAINNSLTMHMVLLSKFYKGYDFGICYISVNDKIKAQIESSIASSTFDK